MNTNYQNAHRRLRRIEGQVRGVARMIEDERYCVDILNQIEAIRAGLGRVAGMVLKSHSEHCVREAIESGDAAEQKQKFDELVDLFERYKA